MEAVDDTGAILQHIYRTRIAQQLPPVFAIISGPSLAKSYRMEELKLVLGRNSPSNRKADIHISDSRSISHEHAVIEYVPQHLLKPPGEGGRYRIRNLSRNGLTIHVCPLVNGRTAPVARLSDPGSSAFLPNPCALSIGNTVVFFQLFFISTMSEIEASIALESAEQEEDEDDEDAEEEEDADPEETLVVMVGQKRKRKPSSTDE